MPNLTALRDTFGFMRGNMLILTITQALGNAARGMVFPYASLFVLALGGTPSQVGMINAVRPLAGLLMFPLAGYIADRAGRVKLIAFGGYLSSLFILLYVLAPNWQTVALAGLLQGFIVFQFPATSAMLADSLTPQDRGKGMATMNCIAGMMTVIAPYIAGAIIDGYGEELGIRILYAAMMVLYFGNAVISHRFLQETSPTQERLRLSMLPAVLKSSYAGIPALVQGLPRNLKALTVIVTLGFMTNAIAGPFWVVYAKQQIGLTAKEWGFILLVETLLMNLLLIPSGMVIDRYGRTRFIVAALVISLVTAPLFVLAKSFTQVLLVRVAMAFTNAFFTPASAALLADAIPREARGRTMAAIGRGQVMFGSSIGGMGGPGVGFLITIPLMIASFVGGYLYEWHVALPWGFVFVAMLASLVLAALYLHDPRQVEA